MGNVATCTNCCERRDEFRTEMLTFTQINPKKTDKNLEDEHEDIMSKEYKTAYPNRSINKDPDIVEQIASSIKIQSYFRGFLVRKDLSAVRNKNPTKVKNTYESWHINEDRGMSSDNFYNFKLTDQIEDWMENYRTYDYTDAIIRRLGKIEIEDGKIYEGEWMQGKREGFGILYYPNGSKYIGYFGDNQCNGLGKQIHSGGEIYIGNWVQGQAEGIGKYINPEGGTYEGEWKKDKQHGFGVEKWEDTSSYIGEYHNSKKNNIGILTIKNQTSYSGQFNSNEIEGIGTFKFQDGRIYKGEFKRNKMNGYGMLKWQDGKYYEGGFKDDKKHGFGIYVANGVFYYGVWQDNKLEGEVLINELGDRTNSFWQDGKKLCSLDSKSIYDRVSREKCFMDLF